MAMPSKEYYKSLTKDRNRFVEFIKENIEFCDETRLTEIFESTWIQRFNGLCNFTYADSDGKILDVYVNVQSPNGGSSYLQFEYRIDFNNSPESELDKLIRYICNRFETIQLFREWVRFGDRFSGMVCYEKQLEGKRRADVSQIMNFAQWLTDDDGLLSKDYSGSYSEMNELGLQYNSTKFKIESHGLTIQSWDNGKLRFSGLTESMIERYKTLEKSNQSHWPW